MKAIVTWSILIVLSVSIVLLARQIQQENIASSNNRPSVAISKTNPLILELIAGDFRGILSDYLVLRTSQFIGEAGKYIPDEDLEALAFLLKEAQQLDPYFFTIPYYAEGSLARNKFIAKKVNSILAISHESRKWDWEPGFYLGFNHFYFIGNNKEAAKIFQQASKRPNAPIILGFLASKFNQEEGNTDASIKVLKIMLETNKNKEAQKEIKKRIEGYKGIAILEKALKKYHNQSGHYPIKLSKLVEYGLLKKLPINPYYNFFWYNEKTGKVSFFPLNE